MPGNSIPRVLSIAGTDPTGGAGIQADLKSIGANGGYGMAVVTALVAQNTQGVRSVHTPPVSFLLEQLNVVSDDVVIDAVKIGMLGRQDVIDVVRNWLMRNRPPVVVLDPVMVSTSGDRLLDRAAEESLRGLVSCADLVTPNLAELAVLLDEPPVSSWEQALQAGKRLSGRHNVAVLVKGGHLDDGSCPDAVVDMSLAEEEQVQEASAIRVHTRNTHGTGCSLSAALATVRTRTDNWAAALTTAKEWLTVALERADDLDVGRGNGPVHHFHSYGSKNPGGFSRRLWDDIAPLRDEILALGFIQQLATGALNPSEFGYYLAQDALYLDGYAEVLKLIAAMAEPPSERTFWLDAADNCINVEAELHRNWLAGTDAGSQSGSVTAAYLEHLRAAAATGSYAIAVAAAIPCFWLYAYVGETLYAGYVDGQDAAGHPYGAWLDTYADEEFRAATDRAVRIMDFAATAVDQQEREAMEQAFIRSAVFEREFFDAPRLDAGAVTAERLV
ncbi:hypothetical protein GCM10027402_28250 [Arthrobacter monumenti]